MVRRPYSEYYLEFEAEKQMITLPYGVKLRILHLPAKNKTSETKEIVYYTGYFSYMYIWKGSIEVLREYHNIWFIETREKEYSFTPDNDLRCGLPPLIDDFYHAIKILELPEENSIYIGSSIASNAILMCMGKGEIRPYKAVLATPQVEIVVPKEIIQVSKIPLWLLKSIRPLLYLYIWYKFRHDKETLQNRKHGISRSLNKHHFHIVRQGQFERYYNMKREDLQGICSSITIISPKYDQVHDEQEVKKIRNILPQCKIIEVEQNSDTHNEKLAQIVLEEIGCCTRVEKR